MKYPKPKKIKLSSVKKKAWAEFSRYIRLKYADKNWDVVCYTCGKKDNYKKLQAGHGIGGRNNAILFDERLVRPQCVGCNMFANGRYYVFTPKLINELGMEAYNNMAQEGRKVVKYSLSDYEALYQKYKKKVEELLDPTYKAFINDGIILDK